MAVKLEILAEDTSPEQQEDIAAGKKFSNILSSRRLTDMLLRGFTLISPCHTVDNI